MKTFNLSILSKVFLFKLLFLVTFFSLLFLIFPKSASALDCNDPTSTPKTWTCSSSKCLPDSSSCTVFGNGTSQPAGCDTGYPSSTWFADGTCGTNGGCHYNSPHHVDKACGYTAPATGTCTKPPNQNQTCNDQPCSVTGLQEGTGTCLPPEGSHCCKALQCQIDGGSCVATGTCTSPPSTIASTPEGCTDPKPVCCIPPAPPPGPGPAPVTDTTKNCPSCTPGQGWDGSIPGPDGTQGMCYVLTQSGNGETHRDNFPPTRTACDEKTQTCTDGCGCHGADDSPCLKTTSFHPGRLPCGGPNETCDTAIGPIKTDFTDAIQTIFQALLAISSLVAIVLIIFSAYRLLVSQGNPENVQKAREQLTAAIVGLLFIIFSFVILEFIGLDLLGLPGITHS